jgi:two-component system, NtrC family, sensor histidine kinase HupT/HoxJ
MTEADERTEREARLIHRAGVADAIGGTAVSEEAWIDVIHRMDAVYADLVHNQLELEEKNGALEEAQRFIGSVLSSMTDVLVVCDLDGRIVRTNGAVEDILGQPRQALEHKPLRAIFAPSSQSFADGLAPRILSDLKVEDAEAALMGKDGASVPLSVNCSVRNDHLGRPVGFVLIGRPIGELRRAFEALDQAHRKLTRTQQQLVSAEKMAALGQLVAGVAHELNNPISFVFGNLYALKRYGEKLTTYLDAVDARMDAARLAELRERLDIRRLMDDIKPLIEGTLEGAQRVSEIVQDLRRFSSSQKEQPDSFNLVRVVQTAADWVTKSARSTPLLVITPAEPIEVKSLRRSVHQIVVNLVQNSVDVLKNRAGGRIEISCGIDNRSAWVKVADDGPGIRPEHIGRVFDPFFTTKPVGEGTGLGLYLSYNLALELGGRIEVESEAGNGARFTLHFPAEGKDDG